MAELKEKATKVLGYLQANTEFDYTLKELAQAIADDPSYPEFEKASQVIAQVNFSLKPKGYIEYVEVQDDDDSIIKVIRLTTKGEQYKDESFSF